MVINIKAQTGGMALLVASGVFTVPRLAVPSAVIGEGWPL
jgi:hypothetical protein